MRAIQRIQEEMKKLEVPFLLLQGSADRLSAVEGARELYAQSGAKDKTLLIYDGFYHELLHEPERDRVLGDILDWLDARCPWS